MRIMALDYGDKRIGVALSDALKMTAQGKEVIHHTNLQADLKRLGEIIEEDVVERIVVGLPRNMNGTYGPRSEKTLQFVEKLKEEFSLPVETWDERLSTIAAERTLLEADVSRKKRKKVIDMMAATIILQGYLGRYY
ncbi:MAG: Holliday junction resolvase RuvX [Halanaerobiales bacterium]|nr:Holliday junction resolvase RuvX [Halanaerobiales bacterium]